MQSKTQYIARRYFFWQFLAAAGNAVHTGAFCSNFVWRKFIFLKKISEDDYSHLSKSRGGWNKRGGCIVLEKTSTLIQ